MSASIKLPQDRATTLQELKVIQELFDLAISEGNLQDAVRLNREYFRVMRYCSALDVIDTPDMEAALNTWKEDVIQLFRLSPHDAYNVSLAVYDLCIHHETQSKSDILIANAVWNCVSTFARPALNCLFKNNKFTLFSKVEEYIGPLMNVMKNTVRHFDSVDLQDTFYDAMSEFNAILSMYVVTPSSRYDYVAHMLDWANANEGAEQLARDMGQLMERATYLPTGQGVIELDIEIAANVLAQEEIAAKKREPVDIQSAFAIRAGLPAQCLGTYQRIEKAFKNSDDLRAGYYLYRLFEELADRAAKNLDGHKTTISAYSYFLSSAKKLLASSPKRAFELAERCVNLIERKSLYSEPLMNVTYDFASVAAAKMMGWDEAYTMSAKDIFKTIMCRASEFKTSNNTEDIFENAAICFRAYLGVISPVERYSEVQGLAIWLGDRKVEPPLLAEFVGGLMNSAVNYGNGMGITLEKDEVATLKSAEIKSFALHPIQPPSLT